MIFLGLEVVKDNFYLFLLQVFAIFLCLITLTDTVKGGIDYHSGDKPMAYVVSPGILSVTLVRRENISF